MLESSYCSLRTADFFVIREQLESIGHVVLTDIWNLSYLENLRLDIERKFSADDKIYPGRFDHFPQSTIDAYLGGTTDIPSLYADSHKQQKSADDMFFSEVDRSGLPGIYRFLLNGDFMIGRSERVVRRFDPSFQMGFVQLHHDYQFGVCADQGLRSKSSYTLWSPLQNCIEDDISRLILLHRGESDVGLTSKEERYEAQEIHYLKRDPSKVDAYMERVQRERRCYAPRVQIGSGILFCRDVVHGTYTPKGASKHRFSMDFRAVGEYRRTRENGFIEGLMYRNEKFRPSFFNRSVRKLKSLYRACRTIPVTLFAR